MSELPQQPDDHQVKETSRTARRGLVLFTIYVILYGGYVLLTTFSPSTMEIVIGGVSLSIIYGMGLIISAFLLALVYTWLCRAPSANKEEPR